jgi:hypothetical protein
MVSFAKGISLDIPSHHHHHHWRVIVIYLPCVVVIHHTSLSTYDVFTSYLYVSATLDGTG